MTIIGRNQPKSLSGIETQTTLGLLRRKLLQRRNQPKSLSGIETNNAFANTSQLSAPEST
jgi:phospholipid N-methyltransferase